MYTGFWRPRKELKTAMLEEVPSGVLLLELHREIEAAAAMAANELIKEELNLQYPPNSGFTENERLALRGLPKSPELESALRKIIANAAAWPLFHLFCLADGVVDPAVSSPSQASTSEGLMLHDALYDSYWAWRKQRPDPGWRLDTYEG